MSAPSRPAPPAPPRPALSQTLPCCPPACPAALLQNQATADENPHTNTAEFDYNTTNNGFTLFYHDVQLADLAYTWDSRGWQWPIIREEFAGGFASACACCDLCRAQPNNAVRRGQGNQPEGGWWGG